MRCQEVRRVIDQWPQTTNAREFSPEMRAHLAACRECARHAQAHSDLAFALSDCGVLDHTDGMPFSAVRSLVEERTARAQHTHSWSTLMTRMAGRINRPAYWIPTMVAVVALLALTLLPWKADQPGSYRVAFAGVDKDLALQEYGVQRVLEQLGIPDANIVVGDCEAACNLTISDLQSEADVGKVMSVMMKLSDCEVLGVDREGDVELNIPGQHTFTFTGTGDVTCQFTNELSDDDMQKIEILVHEVRFGDTTGCCVPGDGHSVFLMKLDSCGSNEFIGNGVGDTLMLQFDIGECIDLLSKSDNSAYSGPTSDKEQFGQQAKTTGSAPISGFQLNQNYPNPFNAATTITFSAPEGGGTATLDIYNIRGQLVKTLVDGTVSGGVHEFTWDATDRNGNPVASGIYLYRLTAGEYSESRQMSLLK